MKLTILIFGLIVCFFGQAQSGAIIQFENGKSLKVTIESLPETRQITEVIIIDGNKRSTLSWNEIPAFRVNQITTDGRLFVRNEEMNAFVEEISPELPLFYKVGGKFYVLFNGNFVELEFGVKTINNNGSEQVVENNEWKFVIKSVVKDCDFELNDILAKENQPSRKLLLKIVKEYSACQEKE